MALIFCHVLFGDLIPCIVMKVIDSIVAFDARVVKLVRCKKIASVDMALL